MSDRHFGSPRGPRRAAPSPTRTAVLGRVRVMGTSRWRPPLGHRRTARLIAVGAAGGGVGKSVVASNLAVAIAGLGRDVVLVDLDLVNPRLHNLFGITRPVPGVGAWIDRAVETLDASLTATGIRNLHLVAGAPRAPERALDPEQRHGLMQQLYQLDSEVVIVDLGRANRDDLLDFFAAGALRVMVSSPDPGTLETSFAFLKGAALRAAHLYGDGDGAREALARFRGRLIGNHARAPDEVERFHAFSRLVREHLGLPLPVLGCLRGSDRIVQSVAARRPLLARRGLDDNVRAFHAMAEALMSDGAASADEEACELEVDHPIAVAAGPLPADLRSYLRKHTRYPVDWAARLVFADRVTEARVLDVSYSGAAIEVFAGVHGGDEGLLVFDQLQGQPSLAVVIRNVLPGMRRIGVAFTAPGEVSARLVAAAGALAAAKVARQ